jgi:glycosyltransferase involved in cell wall biosynthesis
MHLCYLTNEYPKPGQPHGGIGSFLKVICPALAKEGHRVTVINGTYGDREVVEREGVTIIYTPFSNKRGLAWYHNYSAVDREIEILHQNNPIDIVEGSELSFAFITKRNDIAYIIRLHGGHHFFAEGENRKINLWKGYQEKRSFKKADGFIGVSNYVVQHTSKLLSLNNKPVQVIMYPINLGMFESQDFSKIEPYSLVFAGTLIEKKGIRQLCLAMEMVVKAFPQAVLHVYGRDWNDAKGKSYLSYLKSQLSPAILKHVLFHGPVDQKDLPEIYAKANCCIFPSHIETLGLVAPEAMAIRRAVIYTSIGPGPEVVEHGKSGWLCDPHSPLSIAQQIIDVFSDPSEMQKRAIAGQIKVNQQFNIKNILPQNLEFYQKVKAGLNFK